MLQRWQQGVTNLKNPYRFVVAGFNGGINSMCHGGSFKNGFATAFGMSFVGDIVDGAEKTYAGTTTTSQQTHDDPSTLEVMNYGNQLYTQLGETTPGIDLDAIEMYEDLMAHPAFLPTLVKTINDSGGNIMRVINGVPRKVNLDALIKAGGVFDQLNIFDWMPYPMYIDPYANRNMI